MLRSRGARASEEETARRPLPRATMSSQRGLRLVQPSAPSAPVAAADDDDAEAGKRRARVGHAHPLLRCVSKRLVAVGGALALALGLLAAATVRRCRASIVQCGPGYQQPLTPPPKPLLDAARGRVVVNVLFDAATPRHVIVDAQFGLCNRLRAVASAMAVAAASKRPLLVVWVADAHCNCSIRRLLAEPLPFAVSEEPLSASALPPSQFQSFNYVPGEGGSVKREWVRIDEHRHLFVRTPYRIAHERGEWPYAARQLRQLRPRPELASQVVADASLIGLHVRSVVDAIGDYGANGSRALASWREASAWPHFVGRMRAEPPWRRFYLAADGPEAYDGLSRAFPGRIERAPGYDAGRCRAARCDLDRGCAAQELALVDLLNLAATSRLLGSFYSSFSEVARFYGRAADSWLGLEMPFEAAGVDF